MQRIASKVIHHRNTRSRMDVLLITYKGVFTGLHANHPLTGEQLPIYVAPYVLSDYGTGAVMAVPGHDKRDWEFAKANNILEEIKFVVDPIIQEEGRVIDREQPYTAHGVLNGISGKFQGMRSEDAITALTAEAQVKNFGEPAVQYRLRDWLLSRQRYWGAPIPIIHCPTCNVSNNHFSHIQQQYAKSS
jgi:leucyl-tRNA synthetase